MLFNTVFAIFGKALPIASRAIAMTLTLPGYVDTVRTDGYYTKGDGGRGLYKRVAVQPAHGGKFQSADGAWWELSETMPNIKMFGAVGDGVTDDVPAINLAVGYGTAICIPAGIFACGSNPINLSCYLFGMGRTKSILKTIGNGNLFEMLTGSSVVDIGIDGNAGAYTGYAFSYTGTNGNQTVSRVNVLQWGDIIQYFGNTAGSGSSTENSRLERFNAPFGSGKFATVFDPAQQVGAVPRKFNFMEFGGQPSFDFGGCNNVYISNSFLADLNYTVETRAARIANCRIANTPAVNIRGFGNSIVGCDCNPVINLVHGDNHAVQGCAFNNSPYVTDTTGNGRNLIDMWHTSYIPVLSSGGTAPVLGNGTLIGSFSRKGSTVTATANLTLGSTTTLGTGGLAFSLPAANNSGEVQIAGQVLCSRSGTLYTGVVQIGGGLQTATIVRDTSGSITFNSPATWQAGDTMRLSFTYQV